MSKFNMETITCPECKTEQKIKMWEVIDAQDSLKGKKEIIEGNLFRFCCKKCGSEAPLVYRCVYRDDNKKLEIHLLPEKEDIDDKEIDDRYIKRIVSTPNELKEKIMINDKGMDDRVVELLKMVYTSQLPGLTGIENIGEEGIVEMFIDFPEENKYGLVIFFENIEPLMLTVDYGVYIKLYEDFIDRIEERFDNKFTKVDFQWSKEFFTSLNDEKGEKN